MIPIHPFSGTQLLKNNQSLSSESECLSPMSATWSNLSPSCKTGFHVSNGKGEWNTRQEHHLSLSRALCETPWRVRGKGPRIPLHL